MVLIVLSCDICQGTAGVGMDVATLSSTWPTRAAGPSLACGSAASARGTPGDDSCGAFLQWQGRYV
jgi:hypothetical protein